MILLLFPTIDRVSHTYACDVYLFTASLLCISLSFFQPAHHVRVPYMTCLTVRDRLPYGLMFTPEKRGIAPCLL